MNSMENQSFRCLACEQKDEMISKYEKLVSLLKKKLARDHKRESMTSSTNLTNQLINFPLRQVSNLVEKPVLKSGERLSMPRKVYHSEVSDSQSRNHSFEGQVPGCAKLFAKTANLDGYFETKDKKISLISEYREKIWDLKDTLSRKEARINYLTDNILTLKDQHMHFRGIILQFIKSFDLRLKKGERNSVKSTSITIGEKTLTILQLLVRLLEYSQFQQNEIFHGELGPHPIHLSQSSSQTFSKSLSPQRFQQEIFSALRSSPERSE